MKNNNIFKFDYNSDTNSITNESDEFLLFNKIKSVDDVVLLSQPIVKNNGDNTYHISGYVVDKSNKVYQAMKKYYEFGTLEIIYKEYSRFNYASIDSKNKVKVSYWPIMISKILASFGFIEIIPNLSASSRS